MAAPFVPETGQLDRLRDSARGCKGCDLYRDATQTVFGEGPPDARVVMVGEQPGDVEDRRGAPFVGPAGKLLDRAVVVLGATAAKALLSPSFRVTRSRGQVLPWPGAADRPDDFAGTVPEGAFLVATIHPSAVLRADDRDEAYAGLVADLRVAVRELAHGR